MSGRRPEPARLPPAGLPGLAPAWSRLVSATDADGVRRTWHVLDNGAAARLGTIVCVHGNPTWSYLWRHLLAAAPPGWRVVAPDHLGMGYSERLAVPRTLAQRVRDLAALTDALGVDGPVVVVAHDWGGPISLGWALDHRDRVRGVVLTNTAVHQPGDSAAPALIRAARSPALRETVCVRTPAFVRAATALSRPRLDAGARAAFAAPYGTASRRHAVGDFVADIPLEPQHPSTGALAAICAGLVDLADVPVLLVWGPRDPVFSDRYLRDLLGRLPQAQVQRYEGASHLVIEDAPRSPDAIARWVTDLDLGPARAMEAPSLAECADVAVETGLSTATTAHSARLRSLAEASSPAAPSDSGPPRPMPATGSQPAASSTEPGEVSPPDPPFWAALPDRAGDPSTAASTAIVEVGGRQRRVTFGQLEARVRELAAGLTASGVRAGDRVALLVPPGPELAVALYACWRIGAVVVIADAGLGLRQLGRALRGAGPDHVIGIARGLVAATALRVPGRRILAGVSSPAQRRVLGAHHTLADLAYAGRTRHGSPTDGAFPREETNRVPPMDEAAIVDPETRRDEDAGYGEHASHGEDARNGEDTDRGGDAERDEDAGGGAERPWHDDDECAVLFTSGATGAAKGVVYRHHQVRAQLAALRATYGITPTDQLVAAFAPFALYGPLLGIASAVPDVDVTAPADLTATALADAAAAVEATLVFASPSALRNVVETAPALSSEARAALGRVRLVLSAGAPVSLNLLQRLQAVVPAASLHTPYGMTEALPVTDISLEQIEAAGAGNGVCVGRPVKGVQVAVSPLTMTGEAPGEPVDTPEVTGEICVRAAHVKHRYDRLWAVERAASRNRGWHRTSDVGHLDDAGRLWVEGRLAHVVVTATGPVTPVGVEQRVEQVDGVRAAAVVGVGPPGTQQLVVVVVPAAAPQGRSPLADEQMTSAVRAAAEAAVAAVLVTPRLPVDIRHQAKIDRAKVAAWADRVLTGGRVRRRP